MSSPSPDARPPARDRATHSNSTSTALPATSSAASGDARPTLSHAETRSIIVGLMLAIFLGAFDQTIVTVALPRMAQQLDGFSPCRTRCRATSSASPRQAPHSFARWAARSPEQR